jgi:hypothetical protein
MQRVNHVLLVFIDQSAIAERGIHGVISLSGLNRAGGTTSPHYKVSQSRLNLFSAFSGSQHQSLNLPCLGDDAVEATWDYCALIHIYVENLNETITEPCSLCLHRR